MNATPETVKQQWAGPCRCAGTRASLSFYRHRCRGL